jgi:putative SOS response-associated peptidase YedK
MCYSAMVEQDLRKAARMVGGEVDFSALEQLFTRRLEDDSIKIARALESNFDSPATPAEARIKEAIDTYRARVRADHETALFKQKKRLNDAERTLGVRQTRKALEDQRIATAKIAWHMKKLADLGRTESKEDDSRIFPMWYAPVVVAEAGRRVIRPMRYHCRPNGKPESYDRQYDGLYNARRDNLEGFWKNVFGRRHGVLIAKSFFENVALHDFERRALREGEKPKNLILHFNPRTATPMFAACVWDLWQAPGKPDLCSFAAITDEPPPEVAATGHDRCIIPLDPAALEAWLDPAASERAVLASLLDRREQHVFEHRLAA